jgi:hypothetical protein
MLSLPNNEFNAEYQKLKQLDDLRGKSTSIMQKGSNNYFNFKDQVDALHFSKLLKEFNITEIEKPVDLHVYNLTGTNAGHGVCLTDIEREKFTKLMNKRYGSGRDGAEMTHSPNFRDKQIEDDYRSSKIQNEIKDKPEETKSEKKEGGAKTREGAKVESMRKRGIGISGKKNDNVQK